MKDKEVDKCGWAGPLLWVCTKDNYAVHLYDATIILNNKEIEIGSDINNHLMGKVIKSIKADKELFVITFNTGETLSTNSEAYETARVFEQKSKEPHCVYQNGEYNYD